MSDKINNLPVGSDDAMTSVFAALARIESVPTTSTLIDSISDEDWLSEGAKSWKIEAGCTKHNQDELDCCDSQLNSNEAA